MSNVRRIMFKGRLHTPVFDRTGRYLAGKLGLAVCVLNGVTGATLATHELYEDLRDEPAQGPALGQSLGYGSHLGRAQVLNVSLRLAWQPDGLGLSCAAEGLGHIDGAGWIRVGMQYLSLRFES